MIFSHDAKKLLMCYLNKGSNFIRKIFNA